MRFWMPQTIYDAKPWGLVAIGLILAVGSLGWSLSAGLWTVWRSLLCFGGGTLAIIGGITWQMRHDYRARGKWRRSSRP